MRQQSVVISSILICIGREESLESESSRVSMAGGVKALCPLCGVLIRSCDYPAPRMLLSVARLSCYSQASSADVPTEVWPLLTVCVASQWREGKCGWKKILYSPTSPRIFTSCLFLSLHDGKQYWRCLFIPHF